LEEYSIEGKHKYNYVHNTEKAPKPGAEDTYGQNIEPAGKYMNLLTERGAKRSIEKGQKNLEIGTIEFKNPLFIEAPGMSKEWKTVLSEQYGGLTGKALSEAISKDGYDGIITMSKGQPSEVVSFAPEAAGEDTDPLIEEAKKYKTAEEFVAGQDIVYHQTSKEALEKISNEGFKIMRGTSSQGDILPMGINTKSSDGAIALPDEKSEQLQSFLPKDAKIKEFKNREEVEYFLQFQEENKDSFEYYQLLREQKKIDRDYGKEIDILENQEAGMNDEEYKTNLDKTGAVLEEWKAEYNKVGNKAAELGSKILQDLGWDAIKIKEDVGGLFGHAVTDNIIILKKDLAKTKAQLTDIWNKAHRG